jgi:hypothetical protein
VPSPDKSEKIIISRKLSSGFPAKFSFLKKTFPRKFLPEVPYQEACPINQQCKRKLVPQEVDCHPCAMFV